LADRVSVMGYASAGGNADRFLKASLREGVRGMLNFLINAVLTKLIKGLNSESRIGLFKDVTTRFRVEDMHSNKHFEH